MSARRSAAAEAAPLWREVLERMLVRLEGRQPVDAKTRAAKSVEHALVSMQRLEETALADPRHLSLLDEALAELAPARDAATQLDDAGDVARRLEQVVDAMRRARADTLDAVVREQSQAPHARPPAKQAPAAFRASVGVPHLHPLARGFVKPSRDRDDIDLDEAWQALEREAAEAERAAEQGEASEHDDALVLPGSEIPPSWLAGPAAGLRRLVRDALDDIGAMGLLRRARGKAVRHAGIARFEQRLLDNVDALMALGRPSRAGEADALDVLDEARRFGGDAFTSDPSRAFARSFVLGCVEGADPVRAALGPLRRSPTHAREAEIDALSLAPNPEVGEAMRRLCADDDASLVRAALEVLRFRGEGDFGTAVILLSHPDGAVRGAAARCLAMSDERAAARATLESTLADESDRAVGLVMAESLLVLDSPAALAHLRHTLADASRAPRPDAVDRAGLRLLSLAGAARDTRLLASWASDAPQWVRAVGWYGDVSLVEPMLDRMGPSHGHRARTVARTLERLTGEPLLREGRTWEWLVQPRDFRAFWAERQSGYRESERLRFGKPYGAHASIAELERDGSTGDERDCCAFELAMVSAGRARFQPHDWVARQAEQAARARALLAETRSWHQSGEWLGDRLGKRG